MREKNCTIQKESYDANITPNWKNLDRLIYVSPYSCLYSCGEQFKASCEVKVMLSFNCVACFKHEKNATPQTFNRYSHWEEFDKLSKHLCCYWTLSKILRSVGAHLQIF